MAGNTGYMGKTGRALRPARRHQALVVGGMMLLLVGMNLPILAPHAAAAAGSRMAAAANFPVVDPNYIYQELYTLATRYLHREAGYDTNLPASVNGHDEFAAAWAEEMMRDLAGFGPQVRMDSFPISGWSGRPAKTPAFNVEVTVPGVSDPAQMVVIGCHYDGEAISTQSANDDASGCAIELGVARALATYWKANHLYPARTLRFVIFDAEEQGVYGSFHYLNSTINGDSGNVVAMFNEEQSGIAYPLRYLGKASNPLLPFYAYLSPLEDLPPYYPNQSQLPAADLQRITQFRQLMAAAVDPVFAAFQALGYSSLVYHGNDGAPVSQPIFAPDQTGNVQIADDTIGSSDQIAFTMAGIPSAMFVGNTTYYDFNSNPPPPPWSYPNDQPQDTIQLMNVYANGSIQESQALTLALALPGMLTTWMLNQPSVLGSVAWDHRPIAAISDIGLAQPGRPLSLDARASYDPGVSTSQLGYQWSFGDGATASGIAVTHTYKLPGTYTLTLTVTAPNGTRRISKMIRVSDQPVQYANPYAKFQSNGIPPSNPQVHLPALTSQPVTTPSHPANGSPAIPTIVLIVIGIAVLLALLIVLVVGRSRRPAS